SAGGVSRALTGPTRRNRWRFRRIIKGRASLTWRREWHSADREPDTPCFENDTRARPQLLPLAEGEDQGRRPVARRGGRPGKPVVSRRPLPRGGYERGPVLLPVLRGPFRALQTYPG